MIKWLKERQIGNTMNRNPVYENYLGPTFSYKGVIDYGPNEIRDLKWTSDGYLVSNHYPHADEIVIWENPNTHATQRIKSKINLKQSGIHHDVYSLELHCHGSNVILGGGTFDDGGRILDKWGIIYSISLLNGEINEIIRTGLS